MSFKSTCFIRVLKISIVWNFSLLIIIFCNWDVSFSRNFSILIYFEISIIWSINKINFEKNFEKIWLNFIRKSRKRYRTIRFTFFFTKIKFKILNTNSRISKKFNYLRRLTKKWFRVCFSIHEIIKTILIDFEFQWFQLIFNLFFIKIFQISKKSSSILCLNLKKFEYLTFFFCS